MSCQKIIGSAHYYQPHSCLHLIENKPQINADEHRFVNLNIQHLSEVYERNSLIKSPQSMQSTATFVPRYERALPQRLRTRMTQIRRIFTDTYNPCASVSSVQSVFHPKNPNNHISASISVQPQLLYRTAPAEGR